MPKYHVVAAKKVRMQADFVIEADTYYEAQNLAYSQAFNSDTKWDTGEIIDHEIDLFPVVSINAT